MADVDREQNFVPFETVFRSFQLGFLRLVLADLAARELVCAAREFKTSPRQNIDGHPHREALTHLDHVTDLELDVFLYMEATSHLVYATSVLDSFLTDTTRFLFSLFPHSMGRNQVVPVKAVLEATSRTALINEAISKRVREIGFQPFLERIQFLRRTFRLELTLNDETVQALQTYATVRNAIVHDQSTHDVTMSEGGAIEVIQKACLRHPRSINPESLEGAQRAYLETAMAIYVAVAKTVFKRTENPRESELMKLYEEFFGRCRDKSDA